MLQQQKVLNCVLVIRSAVRGMVKGSSHELDGEIADILDVLVRIEKVVETEQAQKLLTPREKDKVRRDEATRVKLEEIGRGRDGVESVPQPAPGKVIP